MPGYQSVQEQVFRAQLTRALLYPLFIVVFAIVAIIVILTLVMPHIAVALIALNAVVPLATGIAIRWSNFLLGNWQVIASATAGAILLIFIIAWTKAGRRAADKLFLKSSFFSSIIKKVNLVFILRSLVSLSAANVSLPKALEITSHNIKSLDYKNSLIVMAEKTKQGESFSSVLASFHNLYPLTISQAVGVGEETGKLAMIMEKLADLFEEDVWQDAKNFKKMFEFPLMVIAGLVLSFLAVATLQPLISALF